MKLSILAGSTSQSINVFIQDSSSTTGAGLTGLVYNSGSLTAYYALPRAAATAITLVTLSAVTSGFSSGGFKEIDATNMPGWYRLDLPDAALASGRFVCVHLKGATNMAPLPLEIELTAWNNQDGVRGGMTALPNAAAGANGGLPLGDASGRVDVSKISGTAQTARDIGASVLLSAGTGTGQVDLTAGVVKANATQFAGQTITAAAGVTLPSSVASPTNITAGTITTVTNLTNAPTTGDFTATMKTSIGTAVAASAVASVTGSVGSVVGLTVANLDVAISTRMATYAQPTGFLAATFPGTVASPTNITAGTITTVTNLTNAPTAGDLTATMKTSVQTAADAAIAASTSINTIGTLSTSINAKTTNLPSDPADASDIATATSAIYSRIGAPTGASIAADIAAISGGGGGTAPTASAIADEVQTRTIAAVGVVNGFAANTLTAAALATDAVAEIQSGLATASALATVATYVDTEVAAIKAKTDNLPSNPAAATDVPTAVQNADALLNRNIEGGSTGGRLVKEALYALRNRWGNSAGVYSVYRADDTTVSWTSVIATDAGALPLTGSDPA